MTLCANIFIILKMAEKEIKVLILEDAKSNVDLIERLLQNHRIHVKSKMVDSRPDFEKSLAEFNPDIILSSYQVKAFSSMDALSMAKEKNPGTPFVMVTDVLGDEVAVSIIKSGAADYVLKENLSRLPEVIVQALEDASNQRKLHEAQDSLKEMTALYMNIFNLSPLAIVIHSQDRIDFINPSGQKLLGAKTINEIIGRSINDFISPGYRKIVAERLKYISKTGNAAPLVEEVYLRLDKTEVDVEVITAPLIYKGRAVFQSIINNISARKQAEKALLIRERELDSIVSSSPDAIIVLDVNFKVIESNREACGILGCRKKEDLVGRNFFTFFAAEDLSRIKEDAKRVLGTGLLKNQEFLLIRDDQHKVAVNLSASALRDASGLLIGTIINAVDISETKKARRSLAEHNRLVEEINRMAVELASLPAQADLFGILAGHLKRITGAVAVLVSYYDDVEKKLVAQQLVTEQEFSNFFEKEIGRPLMGLEVPVSTEQYWDLLKDQGIADGQDLSDVFLGKITKSVSVKFNRTFDVSGFYRVAFMFGDRLVGTAVLILPKEKTEENRDILKMFANVAAVSIIRKNSENALAENEELYRSLVEMAPDGVAIHSDGIILYANPAIVRMLGAQHAGDLLGKSFTAVLHPDSMKTVNETIKAMYQTGKASVPLEEKFLRLDGTTLEVEAASSPLLFRGKPSIQVVVRDIGERKKAEREILRKNRELEKLYQLKSDFTSAVSHELRTPLTSLKEGIGLVLDGTLGPVNKDQIRLLELSKRNVDRLHRLINNVLDFSKLDEHKVDFDFESGSLQEIIQDVLEGQRKIIQDKGLYLKTDYAAKLPKIEFDHDRITQVLYNLIGNAIKFTQKGGITVSVTASVKDNLLTITIADTGIGFNEQEKEKLFHKYVQLGNAENRKVGGTGLGLAISKNIIEQHGGKIWAESKPEKGSVFFFTLPIQRGNS